MGACARARVHINGHEFSTIPGWNAHLFQWNALVVSANQFGHFNTNIFVVLLCSHVCIFFLLRSLQSTSHCRHSIYRIIMPIRLTALFHLVCNLHFVLFRFAMPRTQKPDRMCIVHFVLITYEICCACNKQNCNHFIKQFIVKFFCPHTEHIFMPAKSRVNSIRYTMQIHSLTANFNELNCSVL